MRELPPWRSRSFASLRADAGFGLVEGLVASLVLVIGIGAAITVFVSSGHAGATAERHQAAVALAQEELERIRSLPYTEIGLSTLNYPPGGLGGELPDPAARVHDLHYFPANYSGPDGRLPAERLVVGEAGTSYALPGYEAREMESRSGVETAHIYRFITWRDEECPLLALADLDLDLASLGARVTGLLNSLTVSFGAGSGGLLNEAGSSRDTLAALNPVTGSVINQVNRLLATLDQLVTPLNELVNETLAPVTDRLLASLSQLTRLDLTLDVCDMDLSAVSRLSTIKYALAGLEQPLSALTAQQAHQSRQAIQRATDHAVRITERDRACAASSLCWILNGLQGLLNSLTGFVNGVVEQLLGTEGQPGVAEQVEAVPPDIEEALSQTTDGLITDIGRLPDFIDDTLSGLGDGGTDENTKRVVVAVVLQHGGPAGPRQPIWVSTVVTDPYAGLLQP